MTDTLKDRAEILGWPYKRRKKPNWFTWRQLFTGYSLNWLNGCWEWNGGLTSKGYGELTYNDRSELVHRLMAKKVLGFNLKSKKLICHSCDNPKCVNPAHLFIGTYSDNIRDAYRKGRHVARKGQEHYAAKLTVAGVVALRDEYHSGNFSLDDLAAQYGVCRSTVSKAIKGKTWKHIPDHLLACLGEK